MGGESGKHTRGAGRKKRQSHANYNASNRRERNKRRRLERIVREQPNNEQAREALAKLGG